MPVNCPTCGTMPEIHVISPRRCYIRCPGCGKTGKVYTKKQAITFWNAEARLEPVSSPLDSA